jgi:membrane protein YdbS with pleckstrin-like domain
MRSYRIPKEISTELRINKVLYLIDFFLLIGLLVVTMILRNFVHDSFQLPFVIFMAVIAIIMIWRPSTNPQNECMKSIVLIITLLRRKGAYCAIDNDQ